MNEISMLILAGWNLMESEHLQYWRETDGVSRRDEYLESKVWTELSLGNHSSNKDMTLQMLGKLALINLTVTIYVMYMLNFTYYSEESKTLKKNPHKLRWSKK